MINENLSDLGKAIEEKSNFINTIENNITFDFNNKERNFNKVVQSAKMESIISVSKFAF